MENFYSKEIDMKKINQLLSFVLIGLFFVQSAMAQSVVSGKVTDGSGEGLLGVNIIERGSANGTVTDLEGNFSIEVAGNAVLVFTSIGFIEQEVAVNGRTSLNVTLEVDVQQLQEVVVLGYSTQRKQDITGAVTVVDVDAMQASAYTSITDRLQGRAAGVQVISAGQPGSIGSIRIRGGGFMGGNNDPLFVIDGVLSDDSPNLNPNDVESIQILKDAAAAAIYGSRAANGVVVITTKKGKPGQTEIKASAMFGVQRIPQKLDLMNAAQWARINNAARDAGGDARLVHADDLSHGYDTDWQDVVYQNGQIQDINASIATGGDKSSVYFSLNNTYQEGIVKGPLFERVALRLNSEFELLPGLRIGETLLVGRNEQSGEANYTGGGGGDVVGNAISSLPIIPVYDPFRLSGYGHGDFTNAFTFAPNAVGVRDMFKNQSEQLQVLANAYIDYEIIEGLTFRPSISLNLFNTLTRDWRRAGIIRMTTVHQSGLNESNSRSEDWFQESRLSYNKSFGNHSITATAVQVNQVTRSRDSGIEILGGFDGDNAFFQVGSNNAPSNQISVSGSEATGVIKSFVGNLTYNYSDKYLFTANIRRDGDSRFASENRWGTFGGASMGWVVSNESFFNLGPIEYLKLRAGYGAAAAISIGDYQFQSLIVSSSQSGANYNFGPESLSTTGAIVGNLNDRNIKWEVLRSTNIGLELTLLEGAIQMEGEYYFGIMDDLLSEIAVPSAVGVASAEGTGSVLTNAASSDRTGWEFSLTYNGRQGDFEYSVSANAFNSYITARSLVNPFILADNSITRVGTVYGQFFVHDYLGIYTSQEQIDGDGVTILGATPQIGDARYRDTNGRDENNNLTGMPDGNINADDRIIAGDPYPDVSLGLNFEGRYKNFDMTLFFQGLVGRDVINGQYFDLNNDIYSNFTADWDPYIDGQGTDPRVTTAQDVNGNGFISTKYIEDGSFVRLKNLQIGYTINTDVVRNIRVFIGGQNLLTFTKFQGIDPEFDGGDIFAPGTYAGGYPNVRTFNTGLNLTF